MAKELIEFSEFLELEKKLEIKMGTVTQLERINKKMLKLTVDLGEETPRTVVTNIGGVAEVEMILKDRTFPFITNLKPAVISGHESTAMIMIGTGADGSVDVHLSKGSLLL